MTLQPVVKPTATYVQSSSSIPVLMFNQDRASKTSRGVTVAVWPRPWPWPHWDKGLHVWWRPWGSFGVWVWKDPLFNPSVGSGPMFAKGVEQSAVSWWRGRKARSDCSTPLAAPILWLIFRPPTKCHRVLIAKTISISRLILYFILCGLDSAWSCST